MIYLCNRSREDLREICRSDSNGNLYASITDKLTQNHRGEISDERSQKGRMYEVPGSPKYTASSFEQYYILLNFTLTAMISGRNQIHFTSKVGNGIAMCYCVRIILVMVLQCAIG